MLRALPRTVCLVKVFQNIKKHCVFRFRLAGGGVGGSSDFLFLGLQTALFLGELNRDTLIDVVFKYRNLRISRLSEVESGTAREPLNQVFVPRLRLTDFWILGI